ncbi:long-chain-fatty-acid--CoA ligase [Corynebacterium lujinxingii]|uniref:Long-chain fatty acid--CoA ligase n=1 Tax=Corynebacterium lujinxingii TaxID=2763010 RepID=A0A7H0JZF0_9CORY|nr:long-chain-fatty-acid--CoA ligase [Corynebacterium lujinxingii]MBC3179588.1 long-chain fatty acid--CoA ligase [Corynebacterium lujinxingii]NNO10281.1 AMP-binding protein [Corynebacterium lujinxingii]QNP90416.1 long-chain fatty acid--CoA ligase [Corynebacterium lujinxingii]
MTSTANVNEEKPWLRYYPEWTAHSLEYGGKTLGELYDDNLAANGNNVATRFFGRTQTFSELDREVRRAAAGLKAFGVRPGDRVAIMLPNCPQHVAAFFAVQKIGAIAVEHNPLYTAHELRPQFIDHGARVAIVWDKTADTLEKLRADTPLETVVSVNMTKAMPRVQQLALRIPLPKILETRAALTGPSKHTVPWEVLTSSAIGGFGSDLEAPEDITPESTAVILYTSGTTGTPKGAALSHSNLIANPLQGQAWVKELQQGNQRMLATLPFFHAYGLTFSLTLTVLIGSELVLLPAPKMDLIMQAVKKTPPTFVPGVPTVFERMLKAAKKKNVDLSKVQIGFSGASSLPKEIIEEWEQSTGGHLVEGYGLTETSPIIVGNPESADRRPGYIGIPFPDTQIRIVNPDNPDEDMPFGETGEILVKGPQVFSGYFNNPEATEKVFHDGWFRTGDMGVMEEDGFIKLVSRIKELIITGGFNVYPAEVEEVIRTHKDVADVAVVGRPRSDGSEDVVACVVLNDGAALDPDGLKEFARENLTRYKVPRTFYHFDELSKDQMGKIRRREVRDDLLEKLAES